MKSNQSAIRNRQSAIQRSLALAAVLGFGATAHAGWFDINGITAGYGVADAGSYDWTGTFWAGTVGGTTAPSAFAAGNSGYFVGAGSGTTYTVRLGASGSSTVPNIGNLALNTDAVGAISGAAGNVNIGNAGDTGVLALNANNSVGAQGGGTLTVNNPIALNGKSLNFRGGTVMFNGVVSGTGNLIIDTSVGTFGLTSGTLTLKAANTYTAPTDVRAGTLDIGGGGTTGSIAATSALKLSGGALTLTRSDAFTQVFASTAISGGLVGVPAVTAGAGNTIDFATITRNVGSGLDIGSTGTVKTKNANMNANGILGGWATMDGTDWVSSAGDGTTSGAITAYGAYTNDTWAAANNTTVTTSSAPSSDSTTNSLRFHAAGTSTVTLAGTNTITTGGILVTSNVGNNLSTVTGGTLKGAASADLIVFQNNAANGLAIESIIANNTAATGLTKFGSGTLTLSGANSYTGTTRINAGTVAVSGSGTLGATTAPLTMVGGALDLGTTSQTVGAVVIQQASASGDTIKNGTLAGTSYAVSHNVGTAILSANLGGASSTFTMSGVGAVTLSGGNSYGGLTTLSATGSRLNLGNANAIGGGGGLTVTAAATIDNSSGGALVMNNVGTVTLSNNLTFGGTNALTINSALNQSADLSIIMNGTGGLTFGNYTNTGAGNRTLNVNNANGTVTLGNVALSNSATSYSLRIGNNGASNGKLNITGVISDGGTAANSSLTIGGNSAGNIVTLGGANTYHGGTTLTSGTLNINNASALGTGTFTINAGTINNTSGGAIVNANNNTQAWNGDFTFTGSNDLDLGTGAVTMGGNRFVTVSAKTLTVGGVIDDGASSFTLNKRGDGTLTLTGANTYNGNTSITAGILKLNHTADSSPAVLGNVSLSTSTLNVRPVLYLAANNQLQPTASVSATIGGAGSVYADLVLAGHSQTIASYSTTGAPATGTSFIENGYLAGDTGAGILTINNSATVTLGGGTSADRLNIRDNNGTGGGTLALVKDGVGTLVFNLNSASYTGGFTLKNGLVQVAGTAFGTGTPLKLEGGTLSSGDTTARSFPAGNTVSFDGDVTLGDTTNTGALSFAGTGTLTGNRQLTIASDVTFSGSLGENAAGHSLTKSGAGTLALSGPTAYTGNTTVTAGTLKLGNGTANTDLADASTLIIAAGAKVELDFASGVPASDTIQKLYLGSPAVQVPAGTYDMSHMTYGSYFLGSGSLTVTSGPAPSSAYDSWATGAPYNLSGPAAAFDADPDGDGLDNGLEWILGGDPTSGSSSPVPAAATDISGNLVLTFTREETSIGEATLKVLIGTDLATWPYEATVGATSSGPDANGVTIAIDTSATPDAVTVTIPSSLAPSGSIFAKLKAEK